MTFYCPDCGCRESGEPTVDNPIDEACDPNGTGLDGCCACHRREDVEPLAEPVGHPFADLGLVWTCYRPGHYAWMRPEPTELTATYGGAHGRVYVGQAAA